MYNIVEGHVPWHTEVLAAWANGLVAGVGGRKGPRLISTMREAAVP